MRLRRFTTVTFLAAVASCDAPAAIHGTPASVPLSKRPVIVIVHGAFGGGWAFRGVDDLLTADGYHVYRPTLTGQGERVHLATPAVDLQTHINDVVNTILFEDLHEVTLVGHSYGGMVITGVVDRIPGRIKRVIYLDAFLPFDGESADDEVARLQHRTGPTGPDATGYLRPSWVSATQPLPHDVPQPGATFTQSIRLRHPPGSAGLPTTYVLYVPPGRPASDAKFAFFARRAAALGWPVLTLGSDHNAQWSHPAELARLIDALCRR